jgi:hypothetical protein
MSAAMLLGACADEPTGNGGNPGGAVTLAVTPANATITPGATLQLTATPLDSAGQPIANQAILSSTATQVVTVSARIHPGDDRAPG